MAPNEAVLTPRPATPTTHTMHWRSAPTVSILRIACAACVGFAVGGASARAASPPSAAVPRPAWWRQVRTPRIVKGGDWFETLERSLPDEPVPMRRVHFMGPFDNTGRRGFDVEYGPERTGGVANLDATFAGLGGKRVGWREADASWLKPRSYKDLLGLFPVDENAVAYIGASFRAKAGGVRYLTAGSDDTITVWVNGTKIVSNNVYRGADPAQERVTFDAVAGDNEILVKVCNGGGTWGFYLDVWPDTPTMRSRKRVKLLAAMMDRRPAAERLARLAMREIVALYTGLGHEAEAATLAAHVSRLSFPTLPTPVWWHTVPAPSIVMKDTWHETLRASSTKLSLPFERMDCVGPFSNEGRRGFDTAFGPERESYDAGARFDGVGGRVSWKRAPREWLEPGSVRDFLPLFDRKSDVVAYVRATFTLDAAEKVYGTAGSDDTITIWHEGARLVAANTYRGAAPDQESFAFDGRMGTNALLVKICNGGGGWEFYLDVSPHAPRERKKRVARLLGAMMQRFARDPYAELARVEVANIYMELGERELAKLIVHEILSPALPGEERPIAIAVDSSGAPDTAFWAMSAAATATLYYPHIVAMLLDPGMEYGRAGHIAMREMEGVAGASGGTVAVAAPWVRAHPDDYGMVIHEFAHVAQAYPAYDPVWLVEGIADYVRFARFEGHRWKPTVSADNSYTQGYRVAAVLLRHVESRYGPGIVRKISVSLRERTYTDGLFEELTGKSLDELWRECVAAQR